MTREELIRRTLEGLEMLAKLPPEEQWRRMIERGVIDQEGNVLMGLPVREKPMDQQGHSPRMSPTISEPTPITLEGRTGNRYWIQHPFRFTGNAVVDERLSSFPLAVFQPPGRPAHETPIVIALQGLAAPYQWNAFLVPTLLDMGIACALFDTPLAGERSLTCNFRGDVGSEVLPLVEHQVTLRTALVPLLMEAVTGDFRTVLTLLRERHGLCGSRIALFGVSLGTLLAAFTFCRDGIGTRLLGTLGHADLRCFARSYAPWFTPLATSLPGRLLSKLAALWFGPQVPAIIDFLAVLRELYRGGEHCAAANPMTFAECVDGARRVRFLVGQDDPLVRPGDALACARRFADGACYVVPGRTHGGNRFGSSFVEHARYFLGTQLGDWRP